ncbi:metal binding domain of Ada-domain-containing protein [Hypomontagnella monticulosa]|nr:metal binding domain of Ada-domain-containing protein [Hypomontagnella monticulosa]
MSSSSYTSDSSRWNAVQGRDPAADGLFVYAVKTTKIYCRPVCKSRRARRANVSFYNRCHDAERAGFRPCKRCKPEVRGEMPEEAAVARVRSLIEQNLWKLVPEPGGQTQSVPDRTSDLAQKARVSKWHFHRVFKEVTGMTPAEYAAKQRAPRSDCTTPEEDIWASNFDLPFTPNITETLSTQSETPNIDVDWNALINDDIMMLQPTTDVDFEGFFALINDTSDLIGANGDRPVDDNATMGLPS